jgi:hypothetical protein
MTPGATRSLAQQFGPTVWSAVTVRVAWTLMMAGVRSRAGTLNDARDHVLLSLPEGVDPDEAEQLSGPLTKEFLSRMAGEPVRRLTPETDDLAMVHEGWRLGLVPALEPVSDAVLRLHYGDGMPADEVEKTAAIRGEAFAQAQGNLRSLVRKMAEGAGVPAYSWPDSKVDQLLIRLANTAEPGCPQPMDLLSDHNRAHVDACPRCSRAVRMIRGGILAPSDLVATEQGQVPATEVDVVALLLHPDARRARKRVARALGESPVRVGPDVWLMSKCELAVVAPNIRALVADSVLPRHHLRGAATRGRGRWSGSVLLGPVAVDAIDAARSRPWSEIDTLGELPPPRPAPPSSTKWWVMAAAVGLIAAGAGVAVFGPQSAAPDAPIHAGFIAVEDGWEITFDADDLAVIDVVSVTEKGPAVVHRNIRSERGQWSIGDGSYRVYVPDETVVLLASQNGIDDLPALVERSRAEPTPMVALESWVRSGHPTVAWVGSPAIAVEAETPDAAIAGSASTEP